MSQLPSFNPPLRGKSKIKYGDHGVAAALEFVELSARVQVPLIPPKNNPLSSFCTIK